MRMVPEPVNTGQSVAELDWSLIVLAIEQTSYLHGNREEPVLGGNRIGIESSLRVKKPKRGIRAFS